MGDEMGYVPVILQHQFQVTGAVHLGMFYGGLQMLGTDEQFKKYERACLDFSVVGAYAQTELAHGSDIKSL